MSTAWEKRFTDFAGPGSHYPSQTVRIRENEGQAILAELQSLKWQTPGWHGNGRQLGYRICNATDTWTTALFFGAEIVGFYHGSYLWIAAPHRGIGLSTPLILSAASHRGGSCMPPGIVFQGYTANGLAAHRAAHSHAILTALAEGRPVPAAVLEELHAPEDSEIDMP